MISHEPDPRYVICEKCGKTIDLDNEDATVFLDLDEEMSITYWHVRCPFFARLKRLFRREVRG